MYEKRRLISITRRNFSDFSGVAEPMLRPQDVSAVVCTLNSISGIERCLASLRQSKIKEIVVVDAGSSDGTREVAERLANAVYEDPGTGLGNARNIGIQHTSGALILNMGSDNIMPPGQLEHMIAYLKQGSWQGVSARTSIEGNSYASQGLNAWRAGRFRPGPANVIGTPTLFVGDLLRAHPYDASRVFSDDSELCERWTRDFGARFAISDAEVLEVGKTTWSEVAIRCRMYGKSDDEIFRSGREQGWSTRRKIKSILHPAKADFVEPLTHLPAATAIKAAPFLGAFTLVRYRYWCEFALRNRS